MNTSVSNLATVSQKVARRRAERVEVTKNARDRNQRVGPRVAAGGTERRGRGLEEALTEGRSAGQGHDPGPEGTPNHTDPLTRRNKANTVRIVRRRRHGRRSTKGTEVRRRCLLFLLPNRHPLPPLLRFLQNQSQTWTFK